jgi:hypothetical protein
MPKTLISKLAENLADIPQLFTPLKLIAYEIAGFIWFIYWLIYHP